MSNTTARNRDRLIKLLKELFQLDQPELDFGLYRIMHAKSHQITQFLETDLLKEIQDAFGKADESRVAKAQADYDNAIEQARDFGAPNPEETPAAKKAFAQLEAAKNAGSNESEIYDHLYRFFERYYDGGDFMSRRYYARETEGRAAPFAVPYDGREFYLHWANKDQYYIKSSAYLTNYSFDLVEAIKQLGESAGQLNFGSSDSEKTVHFRIVDAQEGEHNNVKADQKREFIPYSTTPVEIIDGALYVNFEYKVLASGYPIDESLEKTLKVKYEATNKSDIPNLWMADIIIAALAQLPEAQDYIALLSHPAPTDKQKKRPILAKYIHSYTSHNSMDYFIHKNLGQFLNRELDFYIKNEIMRLDDLETAEEAHIASYLDKVKVIRRIARALIAMLAQLEDFQKKLWLKKKFVTETQYCITLDRVPESLYADIIANEQQINEWVKLFAIDEIKGDMATVGYSKPLSFEFLRAHPFLVLDTFFFDDDFKAKLLNAIDNLDEQCDGLLIHSENFQALNLLQERYREQVKCIYIDPPYNTEEDRSKGNFLYKDGFAHSSWVSMMFDRVNYTPTFLTKNGVHFSSIGDDEHNRLGLLLEHIFFEKTIPYLWKSRAKPTNAGEAMYRPQIVGEFIYQNNMTKNITYIPLESGQKRKYPNKDKYGNYRQTTILTSNLGRYNRETMRFEINGYTPPIEKRWKAGEAEIKSLFESGRIGFNDDGEPFKKHYPEDDEDQHVPLWTFLLQDLVGTAEDGKSDLSNILGKDHGFDSVKPKELIMMFLAALVENTSNNILDYFSGSGTTGHAVINLNREDNGKRKYILVEMGAHFDTVTKPRIQKVIYSKDWKDGKPISREGISQCFKYLRLESYEDTLNNLVLNERHHVPTGMQKDYLLNYFLSLETQDSPSLLNKPVFTDPTAYQLKIKKTGSESTTLKNIDLIETFNYLIGLSVQHYAKPMVFSADFTRETDPDLPTDTNTRLVAKIKANDQGEYWFRLIEGYTIPNPNQPDYKESVLIVWRKLTDDTEKDNAVLQTYLMDKLKISPREKTYNVIYVNGSHTLPNPVVDGEQTKVRLIEEAFHRAMWSGEEA